MRILFVCTGNICRSPTAEGVLRGRAAAAGLEGLHIESAGTHGYHVGEPPDPRTVEAAARRGYDLSGLRARKLRSADFTDFDLLLAMDRGHLRIMERLRPPETTAQLRLFLEREVPDPYYGGDDGFAAVLAVSPRPSTAGGTPSWRPGSTTGRPPVVQAGPARSTR